jgi:hypothetical protein
MRFYLNIFVSHFYVMLVFLNLGKEPDQVSISTFMPLCLFLFSNTQNESTCCPRFAVSVSLPDLYLELPFHTIDLIFSFKFFY